jgi:Protein of unknown function (DUF3891)
MVIGWPERKDIGPDPSRSAWKQVEEAQLRPHLPCLLVPQPAHAVLAGTLAELLLPAAFGELPREIKQAIKMHDTGWAMIDAAQIQHLRSGAASAQNAVPVSFLHNSPGESAEAWTASVISVERISPAAALVVSRHFTLLATAAGHEHGKFLAAERARQRKLESSARAEESDLVRWTAALGFCDLASLYLICGLKCETAFPLAHPASPEARTAPKVTLRFEENRLRWTPAIFPSGCRAELEALRHPVPSDSARVERLVWESA